MPKSCEKKFMENYLLNWYSFLFTMDFIIKNVDFVKQVQNEDK